MPNIKLVLGADGVPAGKKVEVARLILKATGCTVRVARMCIDELWHYGSYEMQLADQPNAYYLCELRDRFRIQAFVDTDEEPNIS